MDAGEIKRMNNLAKFALRAGSHGTDSNNSTASSLTGKEDREWLTEAISEYAQLDPVKLMKIHLTTVHRFLHPSQKEDDELEPSDVYHALSEICESCEDIDLAHDLNKIGGFDIMRQCLLFSNSEIRIKACNIIGTACQNDEYCQNALLEMDVMPILINIINSSGLIGEDDSERLKAFFALSCMIRGNSTALSKFEKADGFSSLHTILESSNSRLLKKTMFFIKSLCNEDPKYGKIFHDTNTELKIMAILEKIVHAEVADLATVEDALECLYSLVVTKHVHACHQIDRRMRQLKIGLKERHSTEDLERCFQLCDNILRMVCLGSLQS